MHRLFVKMHACMYDTNIWRDLLMTDSMWQTRPYWVVSACGPVHFVHSQQVHLEHLHQIWSVCIFNSKMNGRHSNYITQKAVFKSFWIMYTTCMCAVLYPFNNLILKLEAFDLVNHVYCTSLVLAIFINKNSYINLVYLWTFWLKCMLI